ncbi:Alpha/Beta hydrolase protein [Lasiosphaeria hispida]|uniref:Alpha/Beta hydrolase protein n=1 Tax=Lasiosphaeria hispida TaxID=260671 RepID=A0AAJ0HJV4_9PEZI|nr:Alpha/Beta hydrolase protein [Lasiosphaeria hispida]
MGRRSTKPALLQKTTQVFAVHQIPLECDVYSADDYPADAPVFLFFHSGGLVCGAREAVPPWLVQTCYRRKWPLISASYRLLPQADGPALYDDAKAAFGFSQTLGGHVRRVIAGGASAGFFLATLLAHYETPKPIALLSITGIPTFRHPFFNSSKLIPPDPITEDEIEPFVAEPVSVGKSVANTLDVFDIDKLRPDGARNPIYKPTALPSRLDQNSTRGLLYDYYLYNNMYCDLAGTVDPGFLWPREFKVPSQWPVTIFIQGDQDVDVSPRVSIDVAAKLGQTAVYCEAKGQEHLFESRSFLDSTDMNQNEGNPMAAVVRAIEALDKAVGASPES